MGRWLAGVERGNDVGFELIVLVVVVLPIKAKLRAMGIHIVAFFAAILLVHEGSGSFSLIKAPASPPHLHRLKLIVILVIVTEPEVVGSLRTVVLVGLAGGRAWLRGRICVVWLLRRNSI